MSFDPAAPASLFGTLAQVEAAFALGQSVRELMHTLKGTAISAGANEVARHVDLFREAPSTEALAALRQVLDATRSQLESEGLLAADNRKN